MKNNKNNNKIASKWKDFYFNIENNIVSNIHINNALNSFFKDILANLNKNRIFLIQFKIKTDSELIRSISYVQTVQISEFNILYDIFTEF